MIKLTYTNERGNSIKLGHTTPFFITNLDGFSNVDNNINTVKSANQDGATEVSSNLETRHLTINGEFLAPIQRHRNKLIEVFNPTLEGVLVYERRGTIKKIECRPEASPTLASSNLSTVPYLINLQASDPYWRDMQRIKKEIAMWVGAFEFPLDIPIEGIRMGYREPSLIVSVYNGGNADSGLVIKFRANGTVLNPSLFNINTREELKLEREMTAGEVVTINTNINKWNVELEKSGIVTDIFNEISLMSDWLQLYVGDNLFRYDADDGLDNLDVSIYFDYKYVGV